MRFRHDALYLGVIEPWEMRVELHCDTVAALIIFDQAHQRTHRRIFGRCAKLFGDIYYGAVKTGGVRTCKQKLRRRTAWLDVFLQWISQGDIPQPIR